MKFENKTLQGKAANLLNQILNKFGLILMPYHEMNNRETVGYLANLLLKDKKHSDFQWGEYNFRPATQSPQSGSPASEEQGQ